MVVTSSAHVERLCYPWMAAVTVPKAPMTVTTSAHVERLCGPWMAAVTVPKAPMAMTSSSQVERLCRPFMEGTKPGVDFPPTTAYDFEDFHVAMPEFGLKKQVSKAYSDISTEAGTTPSASPFNSGTMPAEAPWGFSL